MDPITILTILTHTICIAYLYKRKKPDDTDREIERIYMETTTYIETGSKLLSKYIVNPEDARKLLKKPDDTFITNPRIALNQAEDEIQRKTQQIENRIDNIELTTILKTSAIIFPTLITLLSTTITNYTILPLTPIIQTILIIGVEKWIEK